MRVNSDKFIYTPEEKQFSAESSDLCRRNSDLFHRIYPDACDAGISLTSVRSGVEVEYYIDEEHETDDGEVWGWLLKPTEESLRRVPSATGTSVLIFND
jgi:hypothetical protein